jgi:hypothetical protein
MLQEDSRRKAEQYTPLNRVIFILKKQINIINIVNPFHVLYYNKHKHKQIQY